MILIGLGHRACAGKDTVADYLVHHHDFARVAFADELKREVLARMPLTLRVIAEDRFGVASPGDIERMVWQKTAPAARTLLQEYGVAMREITSYYWVGRVRDRITDLTAEGRDRFVITDVRFPNEAEWIKVRLGLLIRVDRDVPSPNAHISERALEDYEGWDYILDNTGNKGRLYDGINTILQKEGIA